MVFGVDAVGIRITIGLSLVCVIPHEPVSLTKCRDGSLGLYDEMMKFL